MSEDINIKDGAYLLPHQAIEKFINVIFYYINCLNLISIMKIALLTLLLIPFLSFSQVSKKEKKSIDKYATSMCDCVNEVLNTLHPKVNDVIALIAEKGQDEAMKDVQTMTEEMDSEELQEFLESFTIMESDEFSQKLDDCDRTAILISELGDEINIEEGDANDYLMEVIVHKEACRMVKLLYDLGSSSDE